MEWQQSHGKLQLKGDQRKELTTGLAIGSTHRFSRARLFARLGGARIFTRPAFAQSLLAKPGFVAHFHPFGGMSIPLLIIRHTVSPEPLTDVKSLFTTQKDLYTERICEYSKIDEYQSIVATLCSRAVFPCCVPVPELNWTGGTSFGYSSLHPWAGSRKQEAGSLCL